MKTKIKHIHTNSGAIESAQSLLNRFRSLPSFTKKFSTTVPFVFRTNLPGTSTVQERLTALEVEHKQATGRAYVNMLPPR